MKRNIFKTAVVALFILLCPIKAEAKILREIPLDGYISNLPDRVGSIIADGWSAYETDGNDNYTGNGAGACRYDEKKIYIWEDYEERCMYHEIGHAFDLYYDEFSDTKEFTNIFEEEKNSAHMNLFKNRDYYIRDTMEYFAESFEKYIIEPATLQTYAPKTYAFIQKKIYEPICVRKDITWTPVGDETTVDISEYLTSVTDVTRDATEDPHAFLYVSGTNVYVKGISKGKTLYTLHGPNNTYMTIRCDVPGKQTKQKKYNKLTDVISEAYGYKNFCIANPNANELLVLAQSADDKDLKITFYDYNKKKVGSYKLINEAKSDDTYGFMSYLKIPEKKFNKIAYYRIGVI